MSQHKGLREILINGQTDGQCDNYRASRVFCTPTDSIHWIPDTRLCKKAQQPIDNTLGVLYDTTFIYKFINTKK